MNNKTIRTVKDFNLKGKRVLVRCDFNVPLNEKGEIEDDFRIKQTIPTIEYLIKKGAKVILMSHLGEPEGKVVERLRLIPIQEKLREYLGFSVEKMSDCVGKEIEKQTLKMKEREVLLLENLRFHREEKQNSQKFARELAKLGDVYVNDAFGVCHRNHTSIVRVSKFLPSAAGLLLEKEIKVLSKALENPWRPLVAIIGGVKIESKIGVIQNLLEIADHVLIGGKIANAVLVVKGISVGMPWPSDETAEKIKKIKLTSTKLHLPIDAVISPDKSGEFYTREAAPGKVRKDEKVLDIGPETIRIFSRIIESAKMIIWSGPLGYFEKPMFEKGTKEIAEKIARNHQAFSIAGGGDTIFALNKFNLRDKFDHVSTGGGAMLSFLAKEEMPGIKVLEI